MPSPQVPQITFRELILDPASAVAEQRRVSAILSTEFAVERFGMMEVLTHRQGAIDLSRSPLPLIEAHDYSELNIGIVENVRLVGRTLRGDVVLGNSPRALEIWPDITAGIVRSLSIGYRILEHRVDKDTLHVTRWQPIEVSLVPVPADPGASFYRSLVMPQPAINNENTITSDAEITAERERVLAIRGVAARHAATLSGVEDLSNNAIRSGESVDAFSARILNLLADADQRSGGHINRIPNTFQLSRSAIESRDFIAAASDAILIRTGLRPSQTHPAANDLRGMSVLDMARSCVDRNGRAYVGESSESVIRAAMGTADFPAILGDTLHKALRQGAENEQATHRSWCVVTEANDFRTQSRVILGSAPDLKKVEELGEYENGPLDEDKNTLVPAKFGRIVSLSWESMLADNLGAFTRLGHNMGQAAIRKEADEIYGALASNSLAGPNLSDGAALFDVGRNNTVSVATGAGKPLTIAALGAARTKLRRQKNVGGGWLNLAPAVLLVPPERETEAEALVASLTTISAGGTVEGNTARWIASLIVVAEPRLTNVDTVYLVANSSMIGTGEIAIVGNGPDLEELEEKKRDALSWKIRHAFASGFVDFRGIVRMTLTT